jgi:hypothetical protein
MARKNAFSVRLQYDPKPDRISIKPQSRITLGLRDTAPFLDDVTLLLIRDCQVRNL